jgi:hypothetical protein
MLIGITTPALAEFAGHAGYHFATLDKERTPGSIVLH